jgi:hypothetical protein
MRTEKIFHQKHAVQPERQLQVVETTRGTMKFKTQKQAYDFFCTIGTWGEFRAREEGWRAMPCSLTQAVEYHLAYTQGGFEEVEKVYAERFAASIVRQQEQARLKALYAPEKELRYAVAALAPRDSELYLSHYSMSHPSYRWGD